MGKGIKCCNCIWKDQCGNLKIKDCEYYDPIMGGENIVREEYETSLKEREEDYDDIVREMNDVRTEEEI